MSHLPMVQLILASVSVAALPDGSGTILSVDGAGDGTQSQEVRREEAVSHSTHQS